MRDLCFQAQDYGLKHKLALRVTYINDLCEEFRV